MDRSHHTKPPLSGRATFWRNLAFFFLLLFSSHGKSLMCICFCWKRLPVWPRSRVLCCLVCYVIGSWQRKRFWKKFLKNETNWSNAGEKGSRNCSQGRAPNTLGKSEWQNSWVTQHGLGFATNQWQLPKLWRDPPQWTRLVCFWKLRDSGEAEGGEAQRTLSHKAVSLKHWFFKSLLINHPVPVNSDLAPHGLGTAPRSLYASLSSSIGEASFFNKGLAGFSAFVHGLENFHCLEGPMGLVARWYITPSSCDTSITVTYHVTLIS